jgi:hypothetical protein
LDKASSFLNLGPPVGRGTDRVRNVQERHC